MNCGLPALRYRYAPGNFVNLDGDPSFLTEISQAISGLEKGQTYQLTFDWPDVQRNDANGPTWNEYLTASLGDQSFDTHNYFLGPPSGVQSDCLLPANAGLCLPAKGFSGWFQDSIDITWDGNDTPTDDNVLLSFLAHGAPSGYPPSVDIGSSLIACWSDGVRMSFWTSFV